MMKSAILICTTMIAVAFNSYAQDFSVYSYYHEASEVGSSTEPNNAWVNGNSFHIEVLATVGSMDGPYSSARGQVSAIGKESSPWISAHAGEREQQSQVEDYYSDYHSSGFSTINYYMWAKSTVNSEAHVKIWIH